MLLVILGAIECHRALSLQDQYNRAQSLFLSGELAFSEQLAADAADRLKDSHPEWADRFRLVQAESAEWGGRFPEAVGALPNELLARAARGGDSAKMVQALSILGSAHLHMQQYALAQRELERAAAICAGAAVASCGELLRARGVFAMETGDYGNSYRLYSESLKSARNFGEQWDESVALMNLGSVCLAEERFDEARDWLTGADTLAAAIGARDVLVNVQGNLGWAMYKLGDAAEALTAFETAVRGAKSLGDADAAITWLTTAGLVYRDSGEFLRATQAFGEALALSQKSASSEGSVNSLVSLLQVALDTGDLNAARGYLKQVTPLVAASGNREDALYLQFAQARIASAEHREDAAEGLLRLIDKDAASQISMRFAAEHELARLLERRGDNKGAQVLYRTALATFDQARGDLKKDDSKLPFAANAQSIYDDYIDFLLGQGKTEEALLAADRSRARMLAQGLGDAAVESSAVPLSPGAIARKAGATLLFYWLGESRSYLWVVTAGSTRVFPLPAGAEITRRVLRYRKALLGVEDPLEAANEDGRALFRILVAPAGDLGSQEPVMILADGALSQLNFETLIAPGSRANPAEHYWIEDATLLDAPSLAMLAAASREDAKGKKLLLMGDAVSPSEEYPELRLAGQEMARIGAHFPAAEQKVFARGEATPEAYLASNPIQFDYIHFVTHGFASSTDPLDSAIILSRPSSADNTFKLYAREIMRHPIHARLVTISACNASGTRWYAGEGLVGLSWAFLRAGAHNAIGSLWEVPDESTPRLMDALYAGLQAGETPAAALRAAKLALLHSRGSFRSAFYWAPFQLYTRV